jgi:hypothetical protein
MKPNARIKRVTRVITRVTRNIQEGNQTIFSVSDDPSLCDFPDEEKIAANERKWKLGNLEETKRSFLFRLS